ncbi:NAD(P)-dependent oxidoreductase, partial [Vibrio alginolyticus]
TGSIGGYLGNAAKAMGIKTIGINRTGIPTPGGEFHQTFHINELSKAFEQADIVVNTLPSTGSIGGYLGNAAKAMGIKTIGINRTGIPTPGGEFHQTFHINELSKAFEQ